MREVIAFDQPVTKKDGKLSVVVQSVVTKGPVGSIKWSPVANAYCFFPSPHKKVLFTAPMLLLIAARTDRMKSGK